MNIPKWIRPLFVAIGLYDGILGIIFLTIPFQLFNAYGVTPPNHIGYVQFPAILLMVFAIMFFNIARDPIANRNLILYGILLKFSYCSVVLYYWFLQRIPSMWVPFAYFDFASMIAFIIAYRITHK
jgi:hypothetical protein